MDGARAFLHRKEQKATKRRLKREPIRAQVIAKAGDNDGLLTFTPARLLWARKQGLRTTVVEWPRRQVTGARLERKRYGILHIRLANGKVVRFELASNTDRDAVAAIIERPAKGKPRAKAAPAAAEDAWAHLGSPEQAKRAVELYKKGLITKQEMEWQLAAKS